MPSPEASTSLRCFIAIRPSPEIVQRIEQAQCRLRQKLAADVAHEAIRWTPPEQFHLTLRFLGDVPRRSLSRIRGALERTCQGAVPFRLSVARPGSFLNRGRPGVIWVGLEGDLKSLSCLQSRMDDELFALGYPKDEKRFHPHITIGRVRAAHPTPSRIIGERIQAMEIAGCRGWEVRRIDLMRSDLSATGATHHLEMATRLPFVADW